MYTLNRNIVRNCIRCCFGYCTKHNLFNCFFFSPSVDVGIAFQYNRLVRLNFACACNLSHGKRVEAPAKFFFIGSIAWTSLISTFVWTRTSFGPLEWADKKNRQYLSDTWVLRIFVAYREYCSFRWILEVCNNTQQKNTLSSNKQNYDEIFIESHILRRRAPFRMNDGESNKSSEWMVGKNCVLQWKTTEWYSLWKWTKMTRTKQTKNARSNEIMNINWKSRWNERYSSRNGHKNWIKYMNMTLYYI